jgi:hypothetical protein
MVICFVVYVDVLVLLFKMILIIEKMNILMLTKTPTNTFVSFSIMFKHATEQ